MRTRLLAGWSAAIVLVAAAPWGAGGWHQTDAAGRAPTANKTVVVYYFHRTVRCQTCLAIEAYTRKALELHFGAALGDGRLAWRPTNIETPGNEHYERDFRLESNSLIVARPTPSDTLAWWTLDRVWDLVEDEEAFLDYVRENVSAVLEYGQLPAGSPATPAAEPVRSPFLWRIAGERPSWLYGTIHLPDDRVLALPEVVERAVDGCDRLLTEIPLDPATQIAMVPRMFLSEGKTLEQVLPAGLYARLDSLFAAEGLPISALSRMKVWAVAMQAGMIDHMVEFAAKQPLDMMLYQRAEAAGKEVGGLETVDEQLSIFDSLSDEEQALLLERTIDLLEQFEREDRDLIGEMVDSYVLGDGDRLWALMHQTYDPDDEFDARLLGRLLFDRNRLMAERMAAELRGAPGKSHFFAVGVGHLVGSEGVAELLTDRGFELERQAGD